MPAHDWTSVSQGIFHHFHSTWVPEIARSLNGGLLPPLYYALAEQVTSGAEPDVIALELASGIVDSPPPGARPASDPGGVAVALPPPKAAITLRTENARYAALRKTVAIRHTEGHRVVALIEVLSRANKASRAELETFLRKTQSALRQGIHVLLVDMHPPGRLDPQGVHGELWSALGQVPPPLPERKLLLAASYEAGEEVTAYLEPFAVDQPLPPMPLFLTSGFYVTVPLEETYQHSFAAVPAYWREKLTM
ncbi:MAG: DUF4058 family protein [Planctomycetes bacterium]|nr:DUF4058 family protein [Planctomycetota bacterium]